jgi:murein DD-endopeptidase MepM/ murein hydrolase activator NlpD
MALLIPLTGGTITQKFGPGSMAIQPSMYHVGYDHAWWQKYPGASYHQNVHAGMDYAGKPKGTPLLAMEAGTVVRSTYDSNNGGGHVVEVEIRPGTRYSYNHCNSRLVGVGAKVARGQKIATIGESGTILQPDGTRVKSTYGVHLHLVLAINSKGSDGVTRPLIRNPQHFLPGGKYATNPAIQPLVKPPTYKIVKIKPGVNIRSTPDLDVGSTNIAYVSRADGIYALNGTKVGKEGTGFQLRGTVTNDDGTWGKLWGFNRYLYVMQGLYA